MRAPTIPGLEDAIEAAWNRKLVANEPSFRLRLDDGLTGIGDYFTAALWDRNRSCDSDDGCPNREPWDRVLDDAEYETMQAAKDEAIALIKQRLAQFAERFMVEHPEAQLREVEAGRRPS